LQKPRRPFFPTGTFSPGANLSRFVYSPQSYSAPPPRPTTPPLPIDVAATPLMPPPLVPHRFLGPRAPTPTPLSLPAASLPQRHAAPPSVAILIPKPRGGAAAKRLEGAWPLDKRKRKGPSIGNIPPTDTVGVPRRPAVAPQPLLKPLFSNPTRPSVRTATPIPD
jgi:hypothetical protein